MADSEHLLARDLDQVLTNGGDLWEDLRGSRLFVTGGTGFVGRWMLETFAWANEALDLDAQMVTLTRDASRFASRAPHLASADAITFLEGDLRTFPFPSGTFTHVLHMATETNTEVSARKPSLEFDTAVDGTRRVLELASSCEASHLLYTSSGAIYGRQPTDCARVSEDDAFAPAPENAGAAYAHGKRAAEFLCSAAHNETGIRSTIARLFAFVGPHLPLDAGYAVGNFIRDALSGEPIRIAGDGTPRRAYLYAGDLALWLWTILLRGQPSRAYNVGGSDDLSILELAETVNKALGTHADILVAQPPETAAPPQRYVPDVSRAERELGLRPLVELEDGIRRAAEYHRQSHPNEREA